MISTQQLLSSSSGSTDDDTTTGLSARVAQLEEELRQEREESTLLRQEMEKHRERWDRLKEAKRRKESSRGFAPGSDDAARVSTSSGNASGDEDP
ncbi:hypothetical protein HK405_003169, partial [Cladochytrium tenue]